MTDPIRPRSSRRRPGVDALAVAVGNVHGFTPEPVRLDLERLRAIAAVCPVPLVLHGASGLPEEDLRGRGRGGRRQGQHQRRAAPRAPVGAGGRDGRGVGDDVRALQKRAIEAMTEVAAEKIALLAP